MSWFLAIAGFAALIILHEAGHFVAAKWTGMRVERFFLFFPPKVVSIRRGETEYGIGAIPLGGFVKITGMNPDEVEPRDPSEGPREAGWLEKVESVDQEGPGASRPGEPLPPELRERAYYNQPVWKRIVVIAAGPVVNVVIAFFLLFGLALGQEEPSGPGLEVSEVQKGSPAEGSLQPGDEIVSVDGVAAANLSAEDRARKFSELIGSHKCAGQQTDGCAAATPVKLVVDRGGREVPIQVAPVYDEDLANSLETEGASAAVAHRPRIGFGFEPTDFAPANYSVPTAAEKAVDDMWFVTSRTVSVIARIFDAEQRKQITGIAYNADATQNAFDADIRIALLLLAVISLSLGLINLFPFLPLDGGHIFWSVVEKIRGRRVPFAVMERASALGFVLVLMLFIIGLTNDIDRLSSGEGFNAR